MEMKIQKIKSDLIFNTSPKISSNSISSIESILIETIQETIKSENNDELINTFNEVEVSKKLFIILMKTSESEFSLISNFLVLKKFFFSLDSLKKYFDESFDMSNRAQLSSCLSNYLKILQISLLYYPSINNVDLESQSSWLDYLYEVIKDTKELNEILPLLLITAKIVYFKYNEISATDREKVNSLVNKIEKASSDQKLILNTNTTFELEIESIRTTVQNYLIKNGIKFETSCPLSELMNIFNKSKNKKESLNTSLINKKQTLEKISNIVHEIKTFNRSNFTLHEEIDYLAKIENLFGEFQQIDDNLQGIFQSLTNTIYKLKDTTKKKILKRIKDYINVNNKAIQINFEMNLLDIENINSLFPNIYIDLIISIYENFLRFLIIKNAEITYDLKDNTISMKINLKVDQSEINSSFNFINKVKATKEIFKILKSLNYSKLESFRLKYSFIHGELTKTAENNIYYILAVLLKNSFELYKESVKSKESTDYIESIRNFDEVITFIRTNFEILRDYKFCDDEELLCLIADETSDDKVILKFRDNVVNSYNDVKNNLLKQFNLIDFTIDLFFPDLDSNEERVVKLNQFIYTHFNFSYLVTISQSFETLVSQIISILLDNHKFSIDRKIDLIQKLINILVHLYNFYLRNLSQVEKTILLNNIEVLRVMCSFIKNFYVKYIGNNSLITVIENIDIYLKKYYIDNLSENIQLLISEINEMIMNYESFENSNSERNRYQGFLNKIISIILSHFNKWNYLSEKDFLYFFNYITTLVFDRICKMILKVKSFSVEDCKTLSKLLISFKDNYYEGLIVKFLSSKELLSDEANQFFNSNIKVKKFYEIHFLLEANLKQVRHFIENNDKVSIDKHEFIDYIKSLFEDSSNRMSVINLIEKNL